MKRVNKILSIIVYCMLFAFSLFSQSFKLLSKYEKRWALAHPFASIKVKKYTKQCRSIVAEISKTGVLDTFNNGGKIDAFRHTYTMAVLAQHLKVKKIRKLGVAHEKGNYLQFKNKTIEEGEIPDSLSCVMDLKNNEIGFEIGKDNPHVNGFDLTKLVIQKINCGHCFIIKRNENGEYVKCDNSILKLAYWQGIWSVPKCLVKSNE